MGNACFTRKESTLIIGKGVLIKIGREVAPFISAQLKALSSFELKTPITVSSAMG